MAKALALIKPKEETPTPKRERITLIETLPKEEWFVRVKTPRGREVWYLRFQITGMNPQLFGPFASKRQSLLFLDDALGAMPDFANELQDECEKRMIQEECQKIWPPIVEYPILTQHVRKPR